MAKLKTFIGYVQGPVGPAGERGLQGERGIQGERGEPGASGVHVGHDTPPETANVWVDPNGEPSGTEVWTFTLEDGTSVNKTVVVLG